MYDINDIIFSKSFLTIARIYKLVPATIDMVVTYKAICLDGSFIITHDADILDLPPDIVIHLLDNASDEWLSVGLN